MAGYADEAPRFLASYFQTNKRLQDSSGDAGWDVIDEMWALYDEMEILYEELYVHADTSSDPVTAHYLCDGLGQIMDAISMRVVDYDVPVKKWDWDIVQAEADAIGLSAEVDLRSAPSAGPDQQLAIRPEFEIYCPDNFSFPAGSVATVDLRLAAHRGK